MKLFNFSVGIGLVWQVVLWRLSTTIASPTILSKVAPRQAATSSQSSVSNSTTIHGTSNATRTVIAAGKTASSNLSYSSSLTRSMSSSNAISNATQSAIAAGNTASSSLSHSKSLSRSMSFSNVTAVSSGGGDTTTVPLVNSPIVLPAFTACTSGDTRTATFTSEFAHHTGFETIGQDQDFWNDTGAVWVVKVVSLDYAIQALGTFDDSDEALVSSAITAGSKSSAFTINVPTQGCLSM